MGGSSKQTIGYWYRYCIQFGIGFGPVDAFLEFRGGDRTAWSGRITSNQTLAVNKPNLWGGEKDGEGGIVGDLEVRFGHADQAPSSILASVFGAFQSAHRGKFTTVFRGKYGARNPYPKPCSFKFERILEGWDNGGCWYPEKAAIAYAGATGGELITAMALVTDGATSTGGNDDWSRATYGLAGGGLYILGIGDRYVTWSSGTANFASYTFDGRTWIASTGSLGSSGGDRRGVFFKDVVIVAGGIDGIFTSDDRGASFQGETEPRSNWLAASPGRVLLMSHYQPEIRYATDPHGPWEVGADPDLYGGSRCIAYGDGTFMIGGAHPTLPEPKVVSTTTGESVSAQPLPAFPTAMEATNIAFGNGIWVVGTDTGDIAYKQEGAWHLAADVLAGDGGPSACSVLRFVTDRFYMIGSSGSAVCMESFDGNHWSHALALEAKDVTDVSAGTEIDTRTYAGVGMNPAHILYDSITSRPETGGQGEPVSVINDAHWRGAADKLYAEGFGLCTGQKANETAEEFQQRICNVIDGRLSQSRVDGLYYLDLIRGDYDFDSLPIIHEDDILEFTKEPADLSEAVNQALVEWFDPEAKEDRTTAPTQSLGAIQSAGGIISETHTLREIPVESLAIRVGKSKLDSKAKPLTRSNLVTNRVAYALRPGLYFRLQMPSEGIGDMVCLAGDIEDGELINGRLRIVAVQDVFAMPDTVYVGEQPGLDDPPSQIALAPPHQRAIELPYVELAQAMSGSQLSALGGDAGFLGTMASRPNGVSLNYRIASSAGSEPLVDRGSGEWCPTALVVGSVSPDQTVFMLSGAELLDRVVLGSWALWDDEICRVDALDMETSAVRLGRGCADSVPAVDHAAGSRIYFCGDWVSSDQREYVGGETVHAKVLTRTSADILDEAAAPMMSVVMQDRAARPYPPGQFRINGNQRPESAYGEIIVSGVARDRLLQADLLVDSEAAAVGPEIGTTLTIRWYLDDELVHTDTGVAFPGASYTPSADGALRIELASERDGLASWQFHSHTLDYTLTAPAGRLTEAGDIRITESGARRILE